MAFDTDALIRCGFRYVSFSSNRYLVAPTYIAPVAIGDAATYASSNGFSLPCPGLVDAIWRASDLKVEPQPLQLASFTQPLMSAPATVLEHQRRIEDQVKYKSFHLLAGTHKDIVCLNGVIGIYGWHWLNGSVIQPFFAGHSHDWIDYSQGLRLIVKV